VSSFANVTAVDTDDGWCCENRTRAGFSRVGASRVRQCLRKQLRPGARRSTRGVYATGTSITCSRRRTHSPFILTPSRASAGWPKVARARRHEGPCPPPGALRALNRQADGRLQPRCINPRGSFREIAVEVAPSSFVFFPPPANEPNRAETAGTDRRRPDFFELQNIPARCETDRSQRRGRCGCRGRKLLCTGGPFSCLGATRGGNAGPIRPEVQR